MAGKSQVGVWGRTVEPAWRIDAADAVQALSWHPSRVRIAAILGSGGLMVGDANGHRCIEAHGLSANALAWLPAGDALVTVGGDSQVRCWNADDLASRWSVPLRGWSDAVSVAGTSGLVAVAAGSRVHLIDPREGRSQEVDAGGTVTTLAWHPGGDVLAVARNGAIRMVLPDGSIAGDLPSDSPVLILRWSPDGLFLAGGCHDASAVVWDALGGARLRYQNYPGKVDTLAWSQPDRFLITGGAPDPVAWDFRKDLPQGETSIPFSAHLESITALVAAHSRNLVASASRDGMAICWQVTPGGGRPLIHALGDAAGTAISFSSDDAWIAWSTVSGRIAVLRAPTG